jgi:hypothetical protein
VTARRLLLPALAGAAALAAYALTPRTPPEVQEARRFMLVEGLPAQATVETDSCALLGAEVRCDVVLPCGARGAVAVRVEGGEATGFVGDPSADLPGLCEGTV